MPLYTEKEVEERQAIAGAGVLFLLALVVAFINAPGMLAVAIITERVGAVLDTGQFWTFSFIASALWLGTCRAVSDNWRSAFLLYAICCAAIFLVLLVCHFGIKLEFVSRYMDFYF